MKPNLSNVVAIDSESTRRLASQSFVASSVMTFRLPEDTTLRALQIRLSGSIVTTFGSGTPVGDDFGPMDNLISSIQVRVGGSDAIKTITPRMASFHQMLAEKNRGERKSSSGAAAATADDVTADSSAFTYGTTGQITSVAESLTIFFECPLALYGKEKTWLNLRGIVGSELVLTTAAFSGLLGYANTAPVVYSSNLLQLNVRLIEARTVEQNRVFDIYRETYQIEPFTAAASGRVIDLNKGQKIIGLSFLARNGAAGSTTTATGKIADDKLIDTIKLSLNGSYNPRLDQWQEMQADVKSRYGVYAPYTTNKSIMQGFNYMDLLQYRVLDTALDVRLMDNVQLEVVTKSAATYTDGASLLVHQHELVVRT